MASFLGQGRYGPAHLAAPDDRYAHEIVAVFTTKARRSTFVPFVPSW